MPDTLRKRGRPRKEPTPKGPRRKSGPKTVWDESLGLSTSKAVRAPQAFFDAWEDMEFRREINNLLLAMRLRV